MSRDVKRTILEAESRGWTVVSRRGRHYKLRLGARGPIVVLSKTPSDGRAIKNMQADLRRAERQHLAND